MTNIMIIISRSRSKITLATNPAGHPQDVRAGADRYEACRPHGCRATDVSLH